MSEFDNLRRIVDHVQVGSVMVSVPALRRLLAIAEQAEWKGPAYEYGVTWGPEGGQDHPA